MQANLRPPTPQRATVAFWVLLCLMVGGSTLPAVAQADLTYEDFEPESTLVVPENPLTRSKFPFVDVHAHQFRIGSSSEGEVRDLVDQMDDMNMAVMVNLSGGSGAGFESAHRATEKVSNRIVHFSNVDFSDVDSPGWGERWANQLAKDVENGSVGLKIYKNLGMFVTDSEGNRVATDDPRIDPVWAKAGELGIPVLIHTGEPRSFWAPWNGNNERWLELKQFPNRRRDDATRFASFEETMAEQHRVFKRHPNTNFINAHLGWLGNDLDRLGRLMDEMPNMYTEIGAVLAELGRQPRAAREFFIKYQDRVLFGKDSWEPSEYYVYFRALETADEYFDYYRRRHAHWKIYGLDLPDEVLRKVYYGNALKIIPGLDASLFE